MTHHTGGCHCGAVRYSVDVDLDHTVICNCSRCQMLGAVMAFAPREAFTLEQGEEMLTEYLFNKQVIHHLFCRVCGVQSFSYGAGKDGAPMVAINVNCLDGVEPRKIAESSYAHDGRSA